MKYQVLIIISTYLFLTACKRTDHVKSPDSYKIPTCNLYQTSGAFKPEFKELELQIAAFYDSQYKYDLIFIEKTTGKPDRDIFKHLSQDSLGNFILVSGSNGRANAVELANKEYIIQLITQIDKGHFFDYCTGFSSTETTKILLVKVGNEVKFSLLLSRDNLNDFSEEDKTKIKNGYELILALRKL